MIVTAPRLPDGAPFPTLLWLTCPWLAGHASAMESAGGTAEWARRLASDAALASRMCAADDAYREWRAAIADGVDPCSGTGIAGQRDPLGTKCLHAHVAAALGGLDDPVGEAVLASTERECPDDRCGLALVESRP
jgi:hypothetical protein